MSSHCVPPTNTALLVSQLKDIQKFFTSKRELSLEELSAIFEDAKSDYLNEDMYTKSEVTKILDNTLSSCKGSVRNDEEKLVNMNLLLIRQVMIPN